MCYLSCKFSCPYCIVTQKPGQIILEYQCPACRRVRSQEYWVIGDNDDYEEVFLDYSDAYDYQVRMDISYYEDNVYCVPFEDLTPEQKDNLAYKLFCY